MEGSALDPEGGERGTVGKLLFVRSAMLNHLNIFYLASGWTAAFRHRGGGPWVPRQSEAA